MKKNLYITLGITGFIVLIIVLFAINNSQETLDSFSTQSVRLNLKGSVSKSESTARKMIDTSNAICGNGIKEEGEGCDDGNKSDIDGCTNKCQYYICGNGIIEEPEVCDNGDNNNKSAVQNEEGTRDFCYNNCFTVGLGSHSPDAGKACTHDNQCPGYRPNSSKGQACLGVKHEYGAGCTGSAPCPQINDEQECKNIGFCKWENIEKTIPGICDGHFNRFIFTTYWP